MYINDRKQSKIQDLVVYWWRIYLVLLWKWEKPNALNGMGFNEGLTLRRMRRPASQHLEIEWSIGWRWMSQINSYTAMGLAIYQPRGVLLTHPRRPTLLPTTYSWPTEQLWTSTGACLRCSPNHSLWIWPLLTWRASRNRSIEQQKEKAECLRRCMLVRAVDIRVVGIIW